MTIYGWDCSHYDGVLTTAVFARARREGITFVTHKIGEGTGGDDPGDKTALAAARDAGIEFVGGYHVVRSGPVGPQVDALLRLADRDEPWWRSFPGWFWQVDLERWSYDPVPATTGIVFARQLRERTGRLVVLYASRGQYGDQLAGWDGPLWNASYPSSRRAPFADLYPGNGHPAWKPYSGRAPTFLQYASSASIAGLSTCDANAFRGSLAELRTLITGGKGEMALRDESLLTTGPDGRQRNALQALTDIYLTVVGGQDPGYAAEADYRQPPWLLRQVHALTAAVAEMAVQEATTTAAITALAAGGGNPDIAPVLAEIRAARAETHDLVVGLQEQLAAERGRVVRLRAALAAAMAAVGKQLLNEDTP